MKFQRSLSILILFVFLLASIQPAQAVSGQAGDEPPWRAVVPPGPCTEGSYPQDLVGNNGIVYFSADDGYNGGTPHGREIWRSDGSESGTWRVTNLTPDDGYISVDLRIAAGNNLYFTIQEPEYSQQSKERLWVTNGAPAEDGRTGALKLDDFWPEAASYTLDAFTVIGENVYFTVNSLQSYLPRTELWVTNGTTTGTHIVKALTTLSQVHKLVAFNGFL